MSSRSGSQGSYTNNNNNNQRSNTNNNNNNNQKDGCGKNTNNSTCDHGDGALFIAILVPVIVVGIGLLFFFLHRRERLRRRLPLFGSPPQDRLGPALAGVVSGPEPQQQSKHLIQMQQQIRILETDLKQSRAKECIFELPETQFPLSYYVYEAHRYA